MTETAAAIAAVSSGERRINICTINEMVTCKICSGYLVDATTVTECLHTFCKSCIVKHLEDNIHCPECDVMIHQSHPLDYIAFDRTMQDIVYKVKIIILARVSITSFSTARSWLGRIRVQKGTRILRRERTAVSQGYGGRDGEGG